MAFISKILAPTDCSEPSIDALKFAVELARNFQAELTLLYVIIPPGPFEYAYSLKQDISELGIESSSKKQRQV